VLTVTRKLSVFVRFSLLNFTLRVLNTDEEKSVGELSNEDAARTKLDVKNPTISSGRVKAGEGSNQAEKKAKPKIL
jgi:hypothetical protein